MKTKLIKSLLGIGLIFSLGGLLWSCQEPIDGGKDKEQEVDEAGNRFEVTETITPIRYTETKYNGGDNGVSINVEEASSDNLYVSFMPGTDVQSYSVAVYPMAFIYNVLINAMNSDGKKELNVQEVYDILATLINNMDDENAAGRGFLINERTYGDDFYDYAISYMESPMQIFQIQPGMDYLVVAQAFFKSNENVAEEGLQGFADLCVCHVKSAPKEVVGNPSIAFKIQAGFTNFSVGHIPNESCGYFYYLTAYANEIDQYIDAYGEDMYCQFLCNYGNRVDAGSQESLAFGGTGAPLDEFVATAVALDINGTSSGVLNRKDFALRDVPGLGEAPECTISTPDRIGATIVEFNAALERNCMNLRYALYPAATANEIMARSDEEKKAFAKSMIQSTEANPAWVITNDNYIYDIENEELKGDRQEKRDYSWELQGGTEYRIIYAGFDRFLRPGELKATDVFTTAPLIENEPQNCKSDMKMSITGTTRTSVTMQFEYNTDNTALYFFQYFDPCYAKLDPKAEEGKDYPIFPDLENDSEETIRLKWLDAFLHFRYNDPFRTPWPNQWRADGDGHHVETYTWSGFDPGTTYKFAYMSEGWDGRYSEVGYCECTTSPAEGGDNPRIEDIKAEIQPNGSYKVTFIANEDTKELRHVCVNSAEGDYNTSLYLRNLSKKDPDVKYEQYVDKWTDFVIGNGLFTSSLTATDDLILSGDISVAFAVAIGGKTEDKFSDLYALVFKDGKVQRLEEYLGVESK